MIGLKRKNTYSVIGVSIAGGVFHNIGQLIVAMMVVETLSVGYYVPVLLVAGCVTGALIGTVSEAVLKRTANIRLE